MRFLLCLLAVGCFSASCASTLGPQLPSANVSPFDVIDKTISAEKVASAMADVPSEVALECYAVAELGKGHEMEDFFGHTSEQLDNREAQYLFASDVWRWLYLRDQPARDLDKKVTAKMIKITSSEIFVLKSSEEKRNASYQKCIAPISSWVIEGSSLYQKEKVPE